jgi:hypothetical protein
MTWYKHLKFAKNPLDIRPNPCLVGLNEQEHEIIDNIVKENICFVNGLTGSGKTSMLLRIQKLLKNHAFIFLDAHDLPQSFSLEKELKKKRNFFDKIALRDYPKQKPVLIIDEFQATDPRLVLNARSKWEHPDKRLIKSIVIAQISKHLDNCSQSFKDRIGSKVVEMRTLNAEELKEMLRRRLSNSKTKTNYLGRFSDDALDLIVKSAGKNPRKVLEYTEKIFDYHHKRFHDLNPIKRKDYSISHHVVRQILEENDIFVPSTSAKSKKVAKAEDNNPVLAQDLSKGFIQDPADFSSGASLVLNTSVSSAKQSHLSSPSPSFISEGLEKDILKFINIEPRTTKDVSINFKISNSKAKKLFDSLKKSGRIVQANKKGRLRLWVVEAETKRLLVES